MRAFITTVLLVVSASQGGARAAPSDNPRAITNYQGIFNRPEGQLHRIKLANGRTIVTGGLVNHVVPATVTVVPATFTLVTEDYCSYFCKNPQGESYCCEYESEGKGPLQPTVNPGQCPQVRPECPGLRLGPRKCSNDARCPGVQKCCFDICVENHICKTPFFIDE